jgi:hypothetical protein
MFGFISPGALPARFNAAVKSCSNLCMLSDGAPTSQEAGISRRAAISAAMLVAAGLLVPRDASAGLGIEGAVSKVFFPKEGYNAPDKTVPGAVTVDAEITSRPEFKAALKRLSEYSALIKDTTTKFAANPTSYDVAGTVKATMKVDDIRSSLNTVNEAFDEETQRVTDKVVRGIIQDIGEIITNSALKPGTSRTPKKIDRTTLWLSKISTDFDHLLAFYN